MVTTLLGRPFKITYLAAYNSDGFNNFINRLVVVFTNASTDSVNYNFGIANEVEGNQYQFVHILGSVGPWHRGVYTVRTQSELVIGSLTLCSSLLLAAVCEIPSDPMCLSQQNVTLNVSG